MSVEKGIRIFQVVFSLALFYSSNVMSWGERGHDIVARLAARHLIEQGEKELYIPFQQREFMLGHLANVPDIVWKSDAMDEAARKNNSPTHYINLDIVNKNPTSIEEIPRAFNAYVRAANVSSAASVEQLGSAPWRIQQLHRLMKQAFERAGNAKHQVGLVKHVNSALLYGGLMAHFVGDLGNPHHTTSDFDGQASGNGGLHAYFESHVVNEIGLHLADSVFTSMQEADLIEESLMKWTSDLSLSELKSDPLSLSLALSIDSYQNLPSLISLDNRHSLIERSTGANNMAKRKHPWKVKQYYEPLIVERLALASTVLAQLWQSAWEQAGSPDLSRFFSFYYPTAPEYIYPDYQ